MNNNSSDDYINGLPSVQEFSSLHLTTAVNAAVSALTDTAGVYFIKCKLTGMEYIGSSMSPSSHSGDHVLKSSNIHLRNAIDKYRLENFVFEVVEFFEPCSDITREENLSLLLAREQHWLDWLWLLPASVRYNFLLNAGSSLGVKLIKETRAKMNAAKKK
jgi:group I intron endonuclease